MDGVKIRAFEIATGKEAMLIYCHRLLSSKESFDLNRFGNTFLREFDVLTFDFRGHSQSGWHSNCGGDEILDLRAIIQYAKQSGYQKIVLLGVGMGGVVAIRQAALFGNTDAVVAVSPCGQQEKLKPWWWNLITDISLTTDYGRTPIRFLSNTRIRDRYWTGSPLYLVNRVNPTPLLLIHSQNDRYLNLEQIQALYDNALEPKKLVILPQSKHAEGLLNKSTAEIIIAWLNEVLSNQARPNFIGSATVATNSSQHSPIQINDIDIQGDIVLPEKMIKNAIVETTRRVVFAPDQPEAQPVATLLTQIKKEVEALHKIRGYTLCQVSEIHLSTEGKLSLKIEVDQIHHLLIEGNRHVVSEQIQQVLQIAEGNSYNAWEIETAVKRLKQFPIFANVESQLRRTSNGNTVVILVKEHSPLSLGLTAKFTDFDRFAGIQFAINQLRSRAWRGFGQTMLGLQHQKLLYRLRLEKGWFRQEAFAISFGFEQFINSRDILDYYFARQEAYEQGGIANTAYKITDNATIHLGLSRKRFTPPRLLAEKQTEEEEIDKDQCLPVDSGFINALSWRLENKGRFFKRGEFFFNWRSQTYMETATTHAHGDYHYTIFQFNFYPQLILSPSQALNLSLHWGRSMGEVPKQKLFSLGGNATLPGYDDDAFVGEHVFLIRAKYDLKWGQWLNETSRLAPLGFSLLFDAGDSRTRSEPLKFDAPIVEVGVELNYNSLIRVGIVKSLEPERPSAYLYFGWHPHLIRPRL